VKSVEKFIKDLDFLLSFFVPLDYSTFYDLAINKRIPSKPSFLLTFDDGLSEFYNVISPILIRKGIPAICFLNSGFVDNKDLFFRYKASLLIEHLSKERGFIENSELKGWLTNQNNSKSDIVQYILAIRYNEKDKLEELAKILHYDFKEYLVTHKPYLSSEQISSLINKGFYFGAHSIDHPEYRFIEFNEQINQTKQSIEAVSGKFNLDYKIFSFPFTDYDVSENFFQKVYNEQIADITFGCAGQKKEVFSRHFQRISFEMGHLSAHEILNSEVFYYMLKALIGKNLIRRK
jgi:peptidoglycan/xylan/chitin deacetylase (PgdA/CDA1 family)